MEASYEGERIDHVFGSSSGEIYLEIVDPLSVRDNHTYQITFEDTLYPNRQGLAGYDTVTTKSYYLVDVTDGQFPDTLVDNSYSLPVSDADLVDGFRLSFNNLDGLGFHPVSYSNLTLPTKAYV